MFFENSCNVAFCTVSKLCKCIKFYLFGVIFIKVYQNRIYNFISCEIPPDSPDYGLLQLFHVNRLGKNITGPSRRAFCAYSKEAIVVTSTFCLNFF